MLDRAPQRRERAVVTHVLESEEPVHAEQQICGPLLGPQHLDEQSGAIVHGREVRGGAAGVDFRRADLTHRQSGVVEGGGDAHECGMSIRTAEHEEHSGTDRRAEREREEQIDRQLSGDDHLGEDQQDDGDDPRSPPPVADERPDDDEHRRQLRDLDHAVDERVAESFAAEESVGTQRGVAAIDQTVDTGHHRKCRDRGNRHVSEQAIAPGRQRDDVHRHPDQERHDLGGAVHQPDGGRIEEVEQLEEVLFHAEDRFLEPDREPGEQHRDRCEHDQPQDVFR